MRLRESCVPSTRAPAPCDGQTFPPPVHPSPAACRAPVAARRSGARGSNASVITVDTARDLVFLPTATAAPDFFGGTRPGMNELANSVVALRASTGALVWAYQVVHHDLWDYDIAAPPMLISLRRAGSEVPAVVVGTKTGMLFVLDRSTGAPLLPVTERTVPASDVPGEATWPTQPFPDALPALQGNRLTADSAFGITREDQAYCRAMLGRLRNEGLFTPPSLRGSVEWPGQWGGINWDGLAWDPTHQLVITPVRRLAMMIKLHRREDGLRAQGDSSPGREILPQFGTPYFATRGPLVSPSGTPCTPPPWGELVAIDLASAGVRWRRPLGRVPWLAGERHSASWGSLVFGGSLVTGGGLVFIGASQDDGFRAFDIDTGELLWETTLPAGGQAAPMSYQYRGRQYVVIAAGGRGSVGTPGDWVVAFALPEDQ
jgi:quinoprotein glucose dehydrogenase